MDGALPLARSDNAGELEERLEEAYGGLEGQVLLQPIVTRIFTGVSRWFRHSGLNPPFSFTWLQV